MPLFQVTMSSDTSEKDLIEADEAKVEGGTNNLTFYTNKKLVAVYRSQRWEMFKAVSNSESKGGGDKKVYLDDDPLMPVELFPPHGMDVKRTPTLPPKKK